MPTHIAARAPDALVEKVDEYCRKHNETRARVIIRALVKFLDVESGQEPESRLDAIEARLAALEAGKTKRAIPRDAAPRREAPLTAPVEHGELVNDKERIYTWALEAMQEWDAKKAKPQWKQLAADMTAAGLGTDEGTPWQNDTLRNYVTRRQKREALQAD
ncbi:hypothetical protein NUL63_004566 [Salmonella enterica]|nr:hypothetical protein [Salmonella enterica]